MHSIRHRLRQFGALCGAIFKQRLAYTPWFWSDVLGQLVLMVIYTYFWRGVFAGQGTVGGMTEAQTIAYVLIANATGMVLRWSLIGEIGQMLRDGSIATELLRPMDFQVRMFAWTLTTVGGTMAQHMLLLGGFAYLFMDLRLPSDPFVWFWWVLSMLLAGGVLFFFDWAVSMISFYSTEMRGLLILRDGIISFFSGYVIPLAMFPDWLKRVAAFLPFGQMLDTPVMIVTGGLPISAVPKALLTQVLWLIGLALISRPAFQWAVRKVTVQGG